MPWKLDENGHLTVNDLGDAIWVDENGEKAVDYSAMSAALSRANHEAAERKNRLREMEARYAAVSHIDDLPDWCCRAAEAMDVLESLTDNGKSLDEHISEQIGSATEVLREQLAEAEENLRRDREALTRRTIEAAFTRSEFVRERLVCPALAADLFAQHFILDEAGRLVAPGLEDSSDPAAEPLSFDEALARLVDGYPGRDFILKGGAGSGSGALPVTVSGGASKSLADCRTQEEKLNYLNNVGV